MSTIERSDLVLEVGGERLVLSVDPELIERLALDAMVGGADASPHSCQLPTRDGHFRAVAHGQCADGAVTLALIHGDPATVAGPLVRHHAACLLGDTFGSLLCDCRDRLESAIAEILGAGAGLLLYTKPAAGRSLFCPVASSPSGVQAAAAPA